MEAEVEVVAEQVVAEQAGEPPMSTCACPRPGAGQGGGDAPGQPLLAIRGVKTFYGNIIALKGVDLDVNQGEIVTLIGANGAVEPVGRGLRKIPTWYPKVCGASGATCASPHHAAKFYG